MPISAGAGTLAGAGISTLGGIISSGYNVHESRQNRRFQRNMANTAHQREMADLKKAGINPLLTAKLGGASTPSGSTSNIQNPASGASEAGSAYAQYLLNKKLNQKQIEKIDSEIITNSALALKYLEETEGQDIHNTKTGVLTPAYKEAGKIINKGTSALSTVETSAKESAGIIKNRIKTINSSSKARSTAEKANRRARNILEARYKAGKITKQQYQKALKNILKLEKNSRR
jgi:hypothetical protein